jgi:hypothetical protein
VYRLVFLAERAGDAESQSDARYLALAVSGTACRLGMYCGSSTCVHGDVRDYDTGAGVSAVAGCKSSCIVVAM